MRLALSKLSVTHLAWLMEQMRGMEIMMAQQWVDLTGLVIRMEMMLAVLRLRATSMVLMRAVLTELVVVKALS